MKRKYETIAIGLIAILAVAAVGIAAYDLLAPHGPKRQSTSADSFIEQPVVDVIIPGLLRQQGSGSANAPLNVTRGQNTSLSIEVYTSVGLTLEMQFRIFALPSGNRTTSEISNSSTYGLLASFFPEFLSIVGVGHGNTTLNLSVLQRAQVGDYNAIISAANTNNSSQVWGDTIQIHVT